jgi:hypothetical protein
MVADTVSTLTAVDKRIDAETLCGATP